MKKFSFIVFLITTVSFAQSLDSIQKLDEVVISTTKYPINKKNAGKIITKITQEDIKLNPQKNVSQLLNELAGIEINGSRSVLGKNQGTYIQGGKAGQVLVIVDGIPVTDPSGIDMSYDLNLLSTSQIQSIEVMRGASGTLYGSGAATAVINIKTLTKTSHDFDLEAGTLFATQRSQKDDFLSGKNMSQYINIRGNLEPVFYNVSLNNVNAGGLSEAIPQDQAFKGNPYDRQNAMARIGYQPNSKLTFQLSGSYTHLYHLFDAGAFADSEVNKNNNKEFKYTFQTNWQHQKGSLNWTTEYKKYDHTYRQYNSWSMAMENSNYKTGSVQSDLFHIWKVSSNVDVLSGINFQRHETDNTTPYGNIEKKTGFYYSGDPYLTINLKDLAGFNMSLGSRYNWHNVYGNHMTFSMNPSYVIPISDQNYTKLMVSWSSAYITPSIYQLHSQYGNTDLTPETTRTIEVGSELKWNTLALNLMYFKRAEENSIIFYTNPQTWSSMYINYSDNIFYVSGVESGLEFTPIKKIQTKVNYTYTKASEQRPYSIPKHKWNARINYNILQNSLVQVKYQYVSDRTQAFFNNDTFQSEVVGLKKYQLVGVSWNQSLMENKLNINLAIDNILNATYVETVGYSTLGRNFAVSLRYNLN